MPQAGEDMQQNEQASLKKKMGLAFPRAYNPGKEFLTKVQTG